MPPENPAIKRLIRRMRILRSHHEKCERRSTPVKTPEDPPDSTVSSPHRDTSDVSDKDYKPPGSPSSSSSCSNASVRTNLSCESQTKPTQSSQPAKTYSKKDILKRNAEIIEMKIKSSQKKDGRRVWDKAHYCVYCKKSNLKMARHLQMKHMDETESDGAAATEETLLEQKSVKPSRKRRGKKRKSSSEESDEEDGLLLTQAAGCKPPRKRRTNKCTDESDGAAAREETLLEQKSVKPSRKRRGNESSQDAQTKTKRAWSEEERSAVQRRMRKFIALRRVPGKQACMLCITQESPALNNRTWKDVKYFVYEILRVNKKLF